MKFRWFSEDEQLEMIERWLGAKIKNPYLDTSNWAKEQGITKQTLYRWYKKAQKTVMYTYLKTFL